LPRRRREEEELEFEEVEEGGGDIYWLYLRRGRVERGVVCSHTLMFN